MKKAKGKKVNNTEIKGVMFRQGRNNRTELLQQGRRTYDIQSHAQETDTRQMYRALTHRNQNRHAV